MKNFLRKFLRFFHLDITKNLKYDRLTEVIMKKVIKPDSNCVDVGCHKGEILDIILKLAPQGKHFAFEPVPLFYKALNHKYHGKALVFDCALSDVPSTSEFQFVKNAPAYSGLKKREYKVEPDIEIIQVQVKTLDDVVGDSMVNFIKIDVEGGEFGVLRGGIKILKKNKPFVVFEFGIGSGINYGTVPGDFYDFITSETKLNISLLKGFLKNKKPLTKEEFVKNYNNSGEYYFIAHPE